MSLSPEYWYHCGRCGNLFSASKKDSVCERCGQSPLPEQAIDEVKTSTNEEEKVASVNPLLPSNSSQLHGKEMHMIRKEKQDYFLVKFTLYWLGGLLLLAVGIHLWNNPGKWVKNIEEKQNYDLEKQSTEQVKISGDNQRILSQARASIEQTTKGVLDYALPEVRAQHVIPTKNVVLSILRDAGNTAMSGTDSKLEIVKSNVLRIHGTERIEVLWQDQQKRKLEMVYAEHDGEWKVDWEAFAKTSTEPWAVFDSGEETKVGTFRMLVRERLPDQFAQGNDMSVVFYEPPFWHGQEPNMRTEEILLDRQSTAAKNLRFALDARKNKQPILGSIFSEDDPEGMARVRVTIERKIQNHEKVFTIQSVDALHWMNIDVFGLDLPKEQSTEKQPNDIFPKP